MNNKTKALIFDIDGTLIDSTKKLTEDTFNAFLRLGIKLNDKEVYTEWKILLKKYNIPLDGFDKSFSYRKSWKESLIDGDVTIFPETTYTLEELKKRGIRLGVLSLSNPEYTEEKLNFFRLTHYFEQIKTINPFESKTKDQAGIEITNDLDPLSLKYIGFVGDKIEDIKCERAIKEHFKDFKLTTGGFYVNREGLSIDDYPCIKSLEEILTSI